MAKWKVTPQWKKSIVERQTWEKDGNSIVHAIGWRWGTFYVYTDDDTPPELEPGVDILNCGYDSEMTETSDGCWEEFDFDECDPDVEEWVREFLEEDSVWSLEEHGWNPGDCEMIIECEMDIEKVEE